MTQPRSTEGRRPLTLTPTHLLPAGHEVRRAERVLRDRRQRKDARSTRRVRDRREEPDMTRFTSRFVRRRPRPAPQGQGEDVPLQDFLDDLHRRLLAVEAREYVDPREG